MDWWAALSAMLWVMAATSTFKTSIRFRFSASAVVKFKGDTEDSGQTFSISVFIPDAIKVDDRDSLGSTQNAFSLIAETQTVWTGASSNE
jgi:hypothetical protein